MKKSIKILSVLLALIMCMQASITVFAASTSVSGYTGKTYTHQTKFDGKTILNGIDVSYHNGTIDWNKVKASGVDYALIRVGYTGYTKSKFSLNYDTKFDKYISGAISAGISVGVYWFSQALNTNEAVTEANWVLSKIGGYDITMPVVFDYEYSTSSSGRFLSSTLTKAQTTANANAFCSTIKAAGYEPMLYANKTFLENKVNASFADTYKVWLAHYSTSTSYAGNYDFWQYSSTGKVSGISGNVDCNFWYTGDAPDIENQTYTGLPIELKPIIIENGIQLTEGIDYVLSYVNNVNVGTANIMVTGIGAYSYLNKKMSFKIVPPVVTSLTLTARTKTSLSYTWASVAGATGYKLYIINNTKGTSFTKSTTGNSTTLNNLTDTNEYTVRVAAYQGAENYLGAYGDASTVHTMPGTVSKLKTKSRASTSITLSWSQKAGADGYKIYQYSPSKKKKSLIATVNSGETTTYKVTGRKSGTLYYYYVSPITKDYVTMEGSKGSKLTTGTTPGKVSLSSAKSSSKKKIKVKWKTQKGSGYQIQYSTSKSFKSNKKTVTVKSSVKSKTITTAKSKKTYYVRVRAYKTISGKKYYGSWSTAKKVKTK